MPHAALDLMLSHRSIRAFTDDPIPENDIARAVQCGQMASTSSAVQAYALLRVRDPQHRRELADLSGPQEKVATAPAFFVVLGDTRRHRLLAQRAGEPYDQRLEAFLISAIDASLFAQNCVLAFEALGYGTCYIGALRNDLARVCRVLSLPEGVYPLYGLCVGKPKENPIPRPRLPIDAVLLEGEYPADDDMLERCDAYDASYRGYLTTRGAKPEQIASAWTGAMSAKADTAARTDLAKVYREQGARLD